MSKAKTKRISSRFITAAYILASVSIICCIAMLFIIGYLASSGMIPQMLIVVVEMVISSAAIFYFAKGFSKDMNKYYRMFFILASISILVETVLGGLFADSISGSIDVFIWALINIVCYGDLLIIGVGKDLGKKVSVGLVSVNLVIHFVTFVLYLVPFIQTPSDLDKLTYLLMTAIWVIDTVVALIMVLAKYSDKAARKGIEE